MTYTRYLRAVGVYRPDRGELDGIVVVIEGDDVVAIYDDPPADAEPLADHPDEYLLPGFVDAHSHASIRPWEGDQIRQMRMDPVRQTIRAAANLGAGTITMRLITTERYADATLAELEAEGELRSPRLLPSGNLPHAYQRARDGADRDRRPRRDLRSDSVKTPLQAPPRQVFAIGGVLSETGGINRALYADDEVAAIMAGARRQGMHVATHAHSNEGARQAVEVGVDTVKHGAAVKDGMINTLDGNGQYVVGTFSLLFGDDGIAAGDADNADVVAKIEAARGTAHDTWRTTIRSGRERRSRDQQHARQPHVRSTVPQDVRHIA